MQSALLFLGMLASAFLRGADAMPTRAVDSTSKSLDARGFSYNSNDITFYTANLPNTAKIIAGQYIVSDLSISSGQDPSGRNYPGENYYLSGTNGHFEFQVGRHKTTPVAQWWDAHVNASSNNYNDEPGSLNFAFTGEMILGLDNGQTLYFDSFALAQGSNPSGNNWWVGGPNCWYYSGTSIPLLPMSYENLRCNARDNTGAIYVVTMAVGETAGLLDKVMLTDVHKA